MLGRVNDPGSAFHGMRGLVTNEGRLRGGRADMPIGLCFDSAQIAARNVAAFEGVTYYFERGTVELFEAETIGSPLHEG